MAGSGRRGTTADMLGVQTAPPAILGRGPPGFLTELYVLVAELVRQRVADRLYYGVGLQPCDTRVPGVVEAADLGLGELRG